MNPIRRYYKSSPRLRRLSRQIKNAFIGNAARFALWSIGLLSLERALAFGDFVGATAYRLLGGSRRLALEHLELAFGDQLTPRVRERVARTAFINAARSFCELAKIDMILRRPEYIDTLGWEHAEALRDGGKGSIVITGHIGNWELLAAYFVSRGLPVAAIARRIYAEGLNELLVNFRSRHGVETILRESPSSARQILRALKGNSVLAMLIDQDTHAPSVSVPFFGKLARTPAAAAALAIRRDIPVVAVFMQRRDDFGWRVEVSPPFKIERTGDHRSDVHKLTAQFSEALEGHIRKSPTDWVWWHRRWRRGPIPRLDLDPEVPYQPDQSRTD